MHQLCHFAAEFPAQSFLASFDTKLCLAVEHLRLEFKLADRDQIHRLFYFFYRDLHKSLVAGQQERAAGSFGLGDAEHARASAGSSSSGADHTPASSGIGKAAVSPRQQQQRQQPQQEERHRRPGLARAASPPAPQGQEVQLEQLAAQFAALIPEYLVSTAQLQGYLMQHKRSPEAAVQGIPAFLDSLV